MNQFDKYVQEYLDVLKYQKNYSSLTIDGYKREIEHFIVYLNKENICDFKDVRYPFLRGYLAQLHSENLSPKTINHKMSSLRGLYRYLQTQGYIDDNPFLLIDSLKQPLRNPDFL